MIIDTQNTNIVGRGYRGEFGEYIPHNATHIIVREDVRVVHVRNFRQHPNIVEKSSVTIKLKRLQKRHSGAALP